MFLDVFLFPNILLIPPQNFAFLVICLLANFQDICYEQAEFLEHYRQQDNQVLHLVIFLDFFPGLHPHENIYDIFHHHVQVQVPLRFPVYVLLIRYYLLG